MRWLLAAPLFALIGFGCAPATEPQTAPTTSTTAPSAPPMNTASVGSWQGEAGDLRLTLDLKPDGTADWIEEKPGEEKKLWTGKWRDEGEELYLLLAKPTNRSALFEKKGETWVEKTIDGEPALKDAEMILKRL